MRDYGTGEWDGGDPDCDHSAAKIKTRYDYALDSSPIQDGTRTGTDGGQYRESCPCGARRVDRQMGLEPTPDLFVAGMVELFREIRRVLAPHGTCWVNLGDTYNSRLDGSHGGWNGSTPEPQRTKNDGAKVPISAPGMKPKDLCGIPWRFALALQADGWWLRSDIIWAKPNPMPESVTDRPTKAHEYVFMLTKQPRYWFDTEAVREPHTTADDPRNRNGYEPERGAWVGGGVNDGRTRTSGASTWPSGGRNVRSVWNIATQPYPEAHFATFPEELARRCILAGCPVRVCRVCGKPSERIVETDGSRWAERKENGEGPRHGVSGVKPSYSVGANPRTDVGWSDCGHNNWRPGVVLDPFIGSGTTAKVARDHQRHAIGIELNEEYLRLAARRLQQLSLLTGAE